MQPWGQPWNQPRANGWNQPRNAGWSQPRPNMNNNGASQNNGDCDAYWQCFVDNLKKALECYFKWQECAGYGCEGCECPPSGGAPTSNPWSQVAPQTGWPQPQTRPAPQPTWPQPQPQPTWPQPQPQANCVTEFTVNAGMIVDSISVNGKTCGKSGGSPKNIKLAPGEIITKITYGQYPFGNSKCLCNLVFHTSNGKKHGPYGHANARSSKYDGEFSANVPCDWTRAIVMDGQYPSGFQGATKSAKQVPKSSGG